MVSNKCNDFIHTDEDIRFRLDVVHPVRVLLLHVPSLITGDVVPQGQR